MNTHPVPGKVNERSEQTVDPADFENTAILQEIIDSADALIFSVDRQYCYTSFNRAHTASMKALYGAQIEIGHPLLPYITNPKDRQEAQHNLDRALAGEELHSRKYFKVTHNPIRSKDGEIIGVAILSHDISHEKQAEEALSESENQFRELFESVLVGVYRTTPDGKILEVNRALVQMMGFPDRKTMLATNVNESYFVANERRHWQTQIERDGIIHGFETRWLRADGAPIWVRETARTVRDKLGRVMYYEGVVEDITDRKRAEQQLAHYAAHAEVRARTTSLLIGQHELEPVLKTACRETVRALHAPAACVYLLDERQPLFRYATSVGIPQEVCEQLPVIPCGLIESIQQDPRVMIIPDARVDSGLPGASVIAELDCRTIIIASLLLNEQWIGLLIVNTVGEVRQFEEDELTLFRSLADQVTLAIGTARLFKDANDRAAKLALLYDAGLALNSMLEPQAQLHFLFKSRWLWKPYIQTGLNSTA